MAELVKVTGMVISTMAVGEYDKRVVILTKERGKIHGFARGAKRPGNSLMAAAQPFVFGEFMLLEGRSAYTISSVKVMNYFEEFRKDMDATCYGCYFLEFADYYGRENADDLEMLKLLYQTVRALCKKTIAYPLIRCIYELKIMAVNGECPQCFECACCHTTENLSVFSARYRGLLCEKCAGHEKMTTISISPQPFIPCSILSVHLLKQYIHLRSPMMSLIISSQSSNVIETNILTDVLSLLKY